MRNSPGSTSVGRSPLGADSQELNANPVFDELFDAIVAGDLVAEDEVLEVGSAPPITDTKKSRSSRSKGPRLVKLTVIAAALVLLAAGLTFGLDTGAPGPKNSLPEGASITPWHAARLLPVSMHPPTSQASANWQLVSLVVDQGWHVNTSGPPPARVELSDDHNLLCLGGSLCLSVSSAA